MWPRGNKGRSQSRTRDSPDNEMSHWDLKMSRIKMRKDLVEKVYNKSWVIRVEKIFKKHFFNQMETLEMRTTVSKMKNSM